MSWAKKVHKFRFKKIPKQAFSLAWRWSLIFEPENERHRAPRCFQPPKPEKALLRQYE